jgi:hypothetical protein
MGYKRILEQKNRYMAGKKSSRQYKILEDKYRSQTGNSTT